MACYLVSYDLRKVRNYEKLYAALKSYGNWAKILESTWAVISEASATQVRDELLQHVDGDDGLFVAKSSGTAAWRTIICKDEWLKVNL